MPGFSVFEQYKNWIEKHEGRINTYANHLIVIFAFSVPILISVRRLSVVLLLLLFLIRGRVVHHLITALRDPLVASFAIYFLVHVVWLIGSDDPLLAKKAIHDASFLLLVPLFATFLDERYVSRVAVAFVLGMFISALVSFGLFFGIVPPIYQHVTYGIPTDPTPIYHHVPYGYMLAITAVVLLHKILLVKKYSFKTYAVIVVFLMFCLNMFIIDGRTGYVLFALLLVIMVALHYKEKSLKPLFIAGVVSGVIVTLAYSYIGVFKEKVDLTVSSTTSLITEKDYNTSIGGRVGMVAYAFDVILERPLLGYGTGNGVSEVRKVLDREGNNSVNIISILQHTHNEYISSLIQFGILGFLAFLNIPLQLIRYSSDDKGIFLKLLGASVILYSLIDIFILGLGMIFTVVTLSSVALSRHNISNASYEKTSVRLLFNYAITVIVFYAIKAALS